MKKLNKLTIILVMFILISLISNNVSANTCGGTLPAGTEVTNASSCLSCHVRNIIVFKRNIFGFKTKEIITMKKVCASEDNIEWNKAWLSNREFVNIYPSDEAYENVMSDIAKENVPIEMDRLMYQNKKEKLNEAILLAWGLNVAIIKLVIELLRITFYVVELLFIVFMFLVIIPHFFFGLRDAIVKLYLRKKNV